MQDGKTVYQRVQHFLIDESEDDHYVDFIGIGNRGIHHQVADSATIGSMAEIMITDRRINVIFVPCE